MNTLQYLIRLDDACPTMNCDKWGRLETLLDHFRIKPLVGIVPDCKDEDLVFQGPNPHFWEAAVAWQQKGWTIALHGYDHCYVSKGGMWGLNPMWKRSEFAGIPLERQREKIKKGVAILKSHGLNPQFFFAPSHTFDKNTLRALQEESEIRIVSDTIGTKPYRLEDFSIIPQVGGHCSKIWIPGTWTFCLHPNLMEEEDFIRTEYFIRKYQRNFVSFDSLNLEGLRNKDWFSKILSWGYFTYRRLRNIE